MFIHKYSKKIKKAANSAFLRYSRRYMPMFCPGYPASIQIESANRCNLRCLMCPIDELTNSRDKRYLTKEEFCKIVDQFPFLRHVSLQGIGEPLMNKELADFIREGSSRGIRMGFITNGTLLGKTNTRELIEAGVCEMMVSLDSADPENYESIRRGAKFDEVVKNIKSFIALRDEMKFLRPSLGIMMVAMRKNIDELERIVTFAYNLGVDSLVVKGLNFLESQSLKIEDKDDEQIEKAKILAVELKKKRSNFNVSFAFEKSGTKTRCRWPWNAVYITVEGDVTPCCNAPSASVLSFGNIFKTPFSDIWNNREYKSFRRSLKNGRPPICSACPDF